MNNHKIDCPLPTPKSGKVRELRRDETLLLVPADIPGIEKFLTLKIREQVTENWERRVKWTTYKAYKETDVGGEPYYATYQGLWQEVARWLKEQGDEVNITYTGRWNFQPNIRAAMLHLLDYQRPWITQALWMSYSGLIGAPTRFGKSYGMTAICEAFPVKTIVTAPGEDLCEQLYEHFKKVLPHRNIKGVWTGSPNREQGEDITIMSADSLHKADHDGTLMVVADEPHALVTKSRRKHILMFHNARKYAFGATLDGRYDKADRLIVGLFGPVIANVTYLEGVALGAISPLVVAMVEVKISKDDIPGNPQFSRAFDMLLGRSKRMAGVLTRIFEEAIPDDWQTMVFIADEKQADFYLEHALPKDGTIAMAKKFKNKAERKKITSMVADNTIKRVAASKIWIQGLTFPDLRVLINMAAGGPTTGAIQKPGRLLQKRPGKNYGVLIDIKFVCTDADRDPRKQPPYGPFIGMAMSRENLYRRIGYNVRQVRNTGQLKKIIQNAYTKGDSGGDS